MKKTMAGYLFILGICLVTSVAQAADNAITNGTFNSTSGWTSTGGAAYGSGSIMEDGSGCIYVYDSSFGTGSGKWTQTVQVKPNTDYSFHWYAMPGGGGGGYYKYSITDANDNVIQADGPLFVNDGQYVWSAAGSPVFNSGDNTTLNVRFISHSGDWVAFDNVYLVAQAATTNAVANSTIHSTFGWTPYGGAQYRTSKSVDMDASGFLLVYDDDWGTGSSQWTQTLQVTPNTDCTLYWYAMPGGTAGGYYKYSITDGSGTVLQTPSDALFVNTAQYEWAAASSPTFNTGNNTTIHVTFISHSGDWVGFDNIFLASRAMVNGAITNGTMHTAYGWTATGGTGAGSGSQGNDGSGNIYLYDYGWGTGSSKWMQTVQGVTPNTEYKLHWYAMPGGAGGGYYKYSITDGSGNPILTSDAVFVNGQYLWSSASSSTFNTGNNTTINVSFISHSGDWVAFDNVRLESLNTVQVTATPSFSPKGGNFAVAQNVTLSCATPNATIRYTTDGSTPTTGSQAYTAPISVTQNTVLKAKAWAEGLAESGVAIADFNFPASFNRPETIMYDDTVAIDGNLTEWTSAQWAPLDQIYYGTPTDIAQAQYAAKWGANGNKIFVAVKVQDDALHLTDTYTGSDARDAVEIYVHTTSTGLESYGNNSSTSAQQYTVGIKSDQNTVWTALAAGSSTDAANFQAVGKVVVEGGKTWLVYEMAITPFDFFGGLLAPIQANVISILSVNDVIGLDVIAVGHNGTAFTGMKSENTMSGKWNDFNAFGLHKLVAPAAQIPGDANEDGMVDVGDLGILAANYGQSPRTWGQGDFNNDSIVDVGDLGILAAHYGEGTSGSVDFSADYAKAFGTAAEEETLDGNSLCSGLGLPLIAGLMLAGLMLVKLED